MDARKTGLRFSRRIVRWLKKYKTSILLACIVFFLVMYINVPGFQASAFDQILSSIILAAGLLNFTYWTMINRQATQDSGKMKIKGKRKS